MVGVALFSARSWPRVEKTLQNILLRYTDVSQCANWLYSLASTRVSSFDHARWSMEKFYIDIFSGEPSGSLLCMQKPSIVIIYYQAHCHPLGLNVSLVQFIPL